MKKLIILIIAIYLISSVSADNFGTFPANQPITLIQTCTSCTYINISSVTAPNSTILVSNTAMTKSNSRFNYTLPGQQATGQYIVCGTGDVEGEVTDWCYIFYITKTGTNPSTAQGLIYFVLLGISLIIFIISLFAGFSIESTKYNEDSATGKIISVNWKRYYKPACWCIAYLMAVWMFNLAYEVSNSYLTSNFISTFFYTFYMILVSLALPLMVVLLLLYIISAVADKKVQKYLERGLQP